MPVYFFFLSPSSFIIIDYFRLLQMFVYIYIYISCTSQIQSTPGVAFKEGGYVMPRGAYWPQGAH
jgi:hypothetical protein